MKRSILILTNVLLLALPCFGATPGDVNHADGADLKNVIQAPGIPLFLTDIFTNADVNGDGKDISAHTGAEIQVEISSPTVALLIADGAFTECVAKCRREIDACDAACRKSERPAECHKTCTDAFNDCYARCPASD